jgi:hypothetical protein
MKNLKYIFYILITLFFIGCNDDEGYVYNSKYELVLPTTPIEAPLNDVVTTTFNITKIAGNDDFFEFTIDDATNFSDLSINNIPFAANEFVKVSGFGAANTITFKALQLGVTKLPIKIKYCGVTIPYTIDVEVTSKIGLLLTVGAIQIEDKTNNAVTNLADRFNESLYNNAFNVTQITLTDKQVNQTWKLKVISALNNIDKIVYNGNEYQPDTYFDFNPETNDNLVIVPKNAINYGAETFSFQAINSDNTESNIVEKAFQYYKVTTSIPDLNVGEEFYDLKAYYKLEVVESAPFQSGGGTVTKQKMIQKQAVSFKNYGVDIKSITADYSMSHDQGTRFDHIYTYVLPANSEEFIISENFAYEINDAYGYTENTLTYTAILTITVVNAYDEVLVFKFKDVNTFTNTPYTF